MVNEDKVIENYKNAMSRLETALEESGRNVQDVLVIGASKTMPLERILFVRDNTDVKIFGENRVQELLEKYTPDVRWHFIGQLQTNKVKYIVDKVDCIQSVDSVKLAGEISRLSEKAGRRMRVLVEVNIGGEESKGGVAPEALEAFLEEISAFPGILVDGLMAIPPICAEKTELRNYFSRMQQSFIDIGAKKIDNVFMNCLSMGMSSDYEEAILCGSTMVRIGSSLFGQRIYP